MNLKYYYLKIINAYNFSLFLFGMTINRYIYGLLIDIFSENFRLVRRSDIRLSNYLNRYIYGLLIDIFSENF